MTSLFSFLLLSMSHNMWISDEKDNHAFYLKCSFLLCVFSSDMDCHSCWQITGSWSKLILLPVLIQTKAIINLALPLWPQCTTQRACCVWWPVLLCAWGWRLLLDTTKGKIWALRQDWAVCVLGFLLAPSRGFSQNPTTGAHILLFPQLFFKAHIRTHTFTHIWSLNAVVMHDKFDLQL